MKIRLFHVWLVVAVAGLLPGLARGGDWPQWRGPGRDGIWQENNLPETLAGLQPRWRQAIGGGYAGIAATGGRVYTLDHQKQPREVERVLCLDAVTGKTLWTHDCPVTYGKMEFGNGPRSTPTVWDGQVYTYGALGHLHCLDAATGKVLWSRDVVKDFKGRIPTWGHSCSPLVDGDRLLVQVGGQPEACLVALERTTGKEVWRGLADRPGYSSPILIQAGKDRQLVYWTPEHVAGLEPATGKVRWQVPYATNYDVTISDPVWHEGILLVSDYWEGSKALRLDDGQPRVAWEGRRLSCLMSTPLWHDGHVYALDRKNGLKCIEMRTGKIKWEGATITTKGNNPQATLVWAGAPQGGRALILNEKGELILARLTSEKYQEISRIAVIEGTWAHPAYADGCVFVRNDKEIVCWRLKR